jgi:hypothetical protein
MARLRWEDVRSFLEELTVVKSPLAIETALCGLFAPVVRINYPSRTAHGWPYYQR